MEARLFTYRGSNHNFYLEHQSVGCRYITLLIFITIDVGTLSAPMVEEGLEVCALSPPIAALSAVFVTAGGRHTYGRLQATLLRTHSGTNVVSALSCSQFVPPNGHI